jgi:glycosyltransferase involved in cell wall biosynthesis
MIAEIGAHIALLAPQCQETYSLTLDELLWSGLPIVCSPFGALPERVEGWNVGYVFDNSIEGLRTVLCKVVGDWAHHVKMFARTHEAPIRSSVDEVSDYVEMYKHNAPVAPYDSEALVRFLQPDLCRDVGCSRMRGAYTVKKLVASQIKKFLSEGESVQS